MHAANLSIETSTLNRRFIHSAAALRKSGEPAEVGYPRAPVARANSSMAPWNGGSIGVPIEQSIGPPSKRSADFFRTSRRSYGYGGGLKLMTSPSILRIWTLLLCPKLHGQRLLHR